MNVREIARPPKRRRAGDEAVGDLLRRV